MDSAGRALVPASLPCVTAMGRHRSGREWLARLPRMIGELREEWGLRLGPAFHGGSCSWVAPAWREDSGTGDDGKGAEPLVLKVTWPHREAAGEGPALRLWDGRGAVRVHAHDPERYALLLERCEPGTELARSHGIPADERLTHAADVLRELWSAPVPAARACFSDRRGTARGVWCVRSQGGGSPSYWTYLGDSDNAASVRARRRGPAGIRETRPIGGGPVLDPLAEVTAQWADLAEERAARRWPAGIDGGLFAMAAGLLRELPHSGADRAVLLHGDFNPGNVLSARRRPWLAIDAKPVTGDPAYDLWPLLEQVDDPFAAADPRAVLTHRTDLVAGELGLDPWRVRAWAATRHVGYTLSSVVEDEDLSESAAVLRQARILADLAGL